MALPSKNRLRKKKDFDRVFKEGSAVKGSFLFIKYSKGAMSAPRLGFIVPAKSFKKAVTRNRIKRVLSGVISKQLKNIAGPYDIVIMVKNGKENDIIGELNELLPKTKLWQKQQ